MRSLSTVDKEGNTYLHWAFRAEQPEIVKFLMDKGCVLSPRPGELVVTGCADVKGGGWRALVCWRMKAVILLTVLQGANLVGEISKGKKYA